MLSLSRVYLKHTAHSLVNVTKSLETADMVTFTAEIFHGNLHFLGSEHFLNSS